MNIWKIICMLVVTLLTCLAVISVRFEERNLAKTLEKAREQERLLQIEWSVKQVQQVAASKNDRIAEQVMKQNMQNVDPSLTYYVKPDGQNAEAQP